MISTTPRCPHPILLLTLLLSTAAVFLARPALAYEQNFICGEPAGTQYTDSHGKVFVADPLYTITNGAGRLDGWALPTQTWKPIGGTADETLYLNQRNQWTEYRFDVPNGDYLVRLHFADIIGNGPGARFFDIAIESSAVLDDLDVIATVGDEHYAMSRAFGVTVGDGQLNVTGTPGLGTNFLNAIQVQSWPQDTQPPATPTGLSVWPSYGRIDLDWEDSSEEDLAGYHVERSETAGGPYTRLTIEPVAVSRYFDDTATVGPAYFYRLVAVDIWGNESTASSGLPGFVQDDSNSPLPYYEIVIDAAQLKAIYADPLSDVYRPATFIYNGQTWNSVGVRFRGGIARNLPKKSWKIKFNEFVPGQRFLNNQEELNLNAHHGERTLLREQSAYHVHHLTGVPASNTQHVRLKVNGDFLGVFTEVEQVDERWLDLRGLPPGGNLYKSEDDGCLQLLPDSLAYVQAYGKKTNRTTGYDDLIDFIELINTAPAESLYHKLAPIFDIEGFFNYYATNIALANDSFFCHNFYLYHDLQDDYWYYLPWDLDSTFGHLEVYTQGVVHTVSLLRGVPFNGLITRLHEIPHFRNRYLDRTLEILDDVMPPAVMDPLIDELHGLMIEDARIDWFKWGWEDNTYVDAGATTVKSFIPLRTSYAHNVAPLFRQPQDLFINEITANNDSGLQDEFGEFDDWFEILNTGSAPVSLAGMFLSDDITMPNKWAIPDTTIAAGGYIIFWADNQPTQGPTHTNFRLGASGEFLGLFGPVAEHSPPIDTKSWGPQLKDVSYGRVPDGGYRWVLMGTPTPAAPNTEQGNLPPIISNTTHQPQAVNLEQPVTVTTTVSDTDGQVASVDLFYDAGSGFVSSPMADDGQSGDGDAGDGVWGATIPGQSVTVTVHYYVRAEDDLGRSSTDPVDAPLETFAYLVNFIPPPLTINEFMASNLTTLADEFGEFDDWVEIYNAGPDSVALEGLALSDNFTLPAKYIFPDTALAAGEFLLIWCDNDPGQGAYHADFRLAATGERIGLFGGAIAGFAPIDTLTFGPQFPDTSLGRDPDGGPNWVLYHPATPGSWNHGGTGIDDLPATAAPRLLTLGPVRPNPLDLRRSGAMTIPFGLPAADRVTLSIYDVNGRLVRRLIDGPLDAGRHHVAWDGRDQSTRAVATGIYFLRLDARGGVRGSKIVVLH